MSLRAASSPLATGRLRHGAPAQCSEVVYVSQIHPQQERRACINTNARPEGGLSMAEALRPVNWLGVQTKPHLSEEEQP